MNSLIYDGLPLRTSASAESANAAAIARRWTAVPPDAISRTPPATFERLRQASRRAFCALSVRAHLALLLVKKQRRSSERHTRGTALVKTLYGQVPLEAIAGHIVRYENSRVIRQFSAIRPTQFQRNSVRQCDKGLCQNDLLSGECQRYIRMFTCCGPGRGALEATDAPNI